ncbi:CCA tRNA nucleotidyltransferase [Clostridium tarantellae]|uniref:CCA tRNA nucleotidyltransferase n=1 Tax=Clostridium tarantellae TaxID=39493 RepID=A0A6I1MHB9_9CLOT|nr:CCA tRNA nucleotidyltransferase [Clostridium tarantellae]MPQ42560.1 CCA tRNA nucleotidyltransferase [Clostridium tarantellae]
MKLPLDVQYILNKFNEKGYEAFLVGGCVRDFLLNKIPYDYDITTNALPEDIINLFDKTIPTGIKHGTITVIVDNNSFEVTTYRTDGTYLNNRNPEEVTFVSNIKEDLSRRDFTINAFAYSPYLGFKDYFNGKLDLDNNIIRCVGNADERFKEDALRMLRAIRFSCQLNFSIHPDTLNAIKTNYKLIKNLSVERIRDEFTKIILSSKGTNGINILRSLNISNLFIPEINELKDLDTYDFYDDTKDSYAIIDVLPSKLHIRLAGLFYKIYHFDSLENICRIALKKLKYDNKTINNTCILLREINTIPNYPNKKSLKKLIKKVSKELIFDLLELKKAYLIVMNEYSSEYIDIIKDNVEEILYSNEPIYLKDLSVNGEILVKELGVKPGKEIGVLLNFLLENVLENPELNTKQNLINLSKQYIKYK